MSFPSDLPKGSIVQLFQLVSGKDRDPGRAAYAAWDLTGYGLYLAFGEVQPIKSLDPELALQLASLATRAPEVLEKYVAYKTQGLPTWLIIIKLVREFGPLVLDLLKKLLEK